VADTGRSDRLEKQLRGSGRERKQRLGCRGHSAAIS
jgi:hypothetical protein